MKILLPALAMLSGFAWGDKFQDQYSMAWDRTITGTAEFQQNPAARTADGATLILGLGRYAKDGNRGIVLIKVDSLGREIWRRNPEVDERDEGLLLEPTSEGGFVIGGVTFGYGSLMLAKVDAEGHLEWRRTFPFQGRGGVPWALTSSRDGGMVVAGWTEKIPEGFSGGFLQKVDASGNQVWFRFIEGPFSNIGHDIRELADGGFVVVGRRQGELYDQGDIMLYRTDSAGGPIFSRIYRGEGHQEAFSVRETPEGFLLGTSKGLMWANAQGDLLKEWVNPGWNRTNVVPIRDGGILAFGGHAPGPYQATTPVLAAFDWKGEKIWATNFDRSPSLRMWRIAKVLPGPAGSWDVLIQLNYDAARLIQIKPLLQVPDRLEVTPGALAEMEFSIFNPEAVPVQFDYGARILKPGPQAFPDSTQNVDYQTVTIPSGETFQGKVSHWIPQETPSGTEFTYCAGSKKRFATHTLVRKVQVIAK